MKKNLTKKLAALGLAVIMGIMETAYYRTGDEFWKRTAKFWMKIFGINFAIGVATGIILQPERRVRRHRPRKLQRKRPAVLTF